MSHGRSLAGQAWPDPAPRRNLHLSHSSTISNRKKCHLPTTSPHSSTSPSLICCLSEPLLQKYPPRSWRSLCLSHSLMGSFWQPCL